MMKKSIFIIVCTLWFATCGQKQTTHTGDIVESTETIDELPLPAIPSSLTAPGERAEYLAVHFWDAMDFTCHKLSLDSTFMEQNFANFLSVLPVVETRTGMAEAVKVLLDKATEDSTATVFLLGVMEKYLHDPNSPMRNEDMFIVFCEQAIKAGGVAQWSKERMEWMLKDARKNRPGTKAADFAYTDRNGNRHTLYTTATAPSLLLILFDPECEHCAEITEELASNTILKNMVDEGKLTILAIDIESDNETWQRTKDRLPQWWVVGHDAAHAITRKAIYPLPATPVIYLLDGNKTVIFKDTTLETLYSSL